MKILIVGSGGREHALAWKLSQNEKVEKLFIAPGNGGTAECGENVAISDGDIEGLVAFAKDNAIDLVVPGPELPLTLGIADALKEAGIPCFGPDKYAAQLEGSKAFAKKVMIESGVPTAEYAVFTDYAEARAYIEEKNSPLVVKADGLAAGKGVLVCEEKDCALKAIDQIMKDKEFGESGNKVVIEEMLVGEEASFLAFSDGRNIVCMPSSQDHKAVGEGDVGLNTGGMGAYSPAPLLPESEYAKTTRLVIEPIVRYMEEKGHPFVGILYAGLMITENGPKVLEYNTRFGDPECQPLLSRLDSDLLEIMIACTEGRLSEDIVRWKKDTAICVVIAAKGYPESYPKGMEISGLADADALPGVKVFQAGTKPADGKVVTSGGRVLGVTALGENLAEAKAKAYEAVEKVHFDNNYYRRDIGDKGIRRENK